MNRSKRMPYYEYHCVSNGKTLEVRHGMDERLETWSELAGLGGEELGTTPADAPVERLMSAPIPATGFTKETGFQGCGTGCACVPQA